MSEKFICDGSRQTLRCPRCGRATTRVKDTRSRPEYMARVRKCLACGRHFRTAEIWVPDELEMQQDPATRSWYIDKMREKIKRAERRRRSEADINKTN